MTVLPFADWKPDLSPYKAASSQRIENVFPRLDGYGPVASVSPYSQPLPGPCRGYFYARNADQSVTVFAATASKLYKLNNTDFSWTDVSKAGGSYTAVGNGEQWQFAQFNNFVIAAQINTVPQVFDLTSASAFADLGGSPPPARYVAVVNRFVVLSGLGTATPYRIQWSGLNAVTTWTAGVNASDFQDLPDGGVVRAIGGGETGLITQDGSLRRMIFAPGAPYVFQIDRVAQDKGIFAPLSLARAGDLLAGGPALEATLDTAEQTLDRRMRIKGFRPMTDAPTCYGSIGARENLQGSVTYSSEQAVNGKGLCPANVSTRLARGRLRIPAGTAWTFASGVEPMVAQEGVR